MRVLAALTARDAELVIVGGPSGADRARRGGAPCTRSPESLGVADRIRWVPPVPHDRLADWYRAADVCLVPSRAAESFGLTWPSKPPACGTPVVPAANVGGLRHLVDHAESGFLVDGPRPPPGTPRPSRRCSYAPGRAAVMGAAAPRCPGRSVHVETSPPLGCGALYSDLAVRTLVQCT